MVGNIELSVSFVVMSCKSDSTAAEIRGIDKFGLFAMISLNKNAQVVNCYDAKA